MFLGWRGGFLLAVTGLLDVWHQMGSKSVTSWAARARTRCAGVAVGNVAEAGLWFKAHRRGWLARPVSTRKEMGPLSRRCYVFRFCAWMEERVSWVGGRAGPHGQVECASESIPIPLSVALVCLEQSLKILRRDNTLTNPNRVYSCFTLVHRKM